MVKEVTNEMLAMFNQKTGFCSYHSGLWSYKCPVCSEFQRRWLQSREKGQ